jgi:RNA polymerase sigma-70 factor (ECF subfamily)
METFNRGADDYPCGREVTSMHAETLETPIPLRCCAVSGQSTVAVRRTHDLDLVRRVQAGDQIAFQEVVERYQSRIFRLIYGILRNRADADQIAQEVFAKVYFSIRTFDGRCTLFTWIYRVAVNECYAYLRKSRVKLVFERDLATDGRAIELDSAADGQPTADRALVERDFVNHLLTQMPGKDRVLLLWKEVEGFSISQLTAMTGLNENTVKVRLFRARQRLIEVAERMSRRRPHL